MQVEIVFVARSRLPRHLQSLHTKHSRYNREPLVMYRLHAAAAGKRSTLDQIMKPMKRAKDIAFIYA